jgi:hypothetical protein
VILKTILILTISFSVSFANKYIEAQYDISYGIFGKLGVSKAIIKVTEDRYKISVKARATGLADTLTGGRREEYISLGQYKNDKYIPHVFKTIKINGDEKNINVYTFNYLSKKIRRVYSVFTLKDDKWKQKSKKSSFVEYFATEDILSIFFNLKNYALDLSAGKSYHLVALGANDKDGRIDIVVPTTTKLKEINKTLKSDKGRKLIVIVNQKIFSSPRGALFISLREDGICSNAVLKDVLFFGDVRGSLKKFKEK